MKYRTHYDLIRHKCARVKQISRPLDIAELKIKNRQKVLIHEDVEICVLPEHKYIFQ